MGREGVLPTFFSRTDANRGTPVAAILFTTAIALVLALTGDFGDLSGTTVLLLLVVFGIVNVSVLVLRRSPVSHEHFRAPAIFPMLGAITCVVLLTQQAADTWLRAGILIAVGLVLYALNLFLKKRSGEDSQPRETSRVR